MNQNSPIKIGIDGSFLSGQKRGHARYAFELCRELDTYLPNANFFIYSPLPIEMPVISPRWKLRNQGKILAVSPILWLKTIGSLICRKDQLDIFWGTYFFLPYLEQSTKTILTVHDFWFDIDPTGMDWFHTQAFYLFLKNDVKRANTIITNSQATDKQLFKYTGRNSIIIQPGVSDIFKPLPSDTVKIELKKHKIISPYLLNVATWEPRKNGLFVTLYAKLTHKMPSKHTSNSKIAKVSKTITSSFYQFQFMVDSLDHPIRCSLLKIINNFSKPVSDCLTTLGKHICRFCQPF
jgi:glycosyltransferase involved in cell wall biosynthesis